MLNADNHTWPVGTRKPNQFGLFDMHGNTWEWVQEAYYVYPTGDHVATVEERNDVDLVQDSEQRLKRGGSFLELPRVARSACRNSAHPPSNILTFGFRVVNTIE